MNQKCDVCGGTTYQVDGWVCTHGKKKTTKRLEMPEPQYFVEDARGQMVQVSYAEWRRMGNG